MPHIGGSPVPTSPMLDSCAKSALRLPAAKRACDRQMAAYVELPRYDFSASQPKPPTRHMIIARYTDSDGTRYEVSTTRTGGAYWLSASKNGVRRSNTLRTTSKARGEEWRAAVMVGNVGLAD